jgi:hypothetical protein
VDVHLPADCSAEALRSLLDQIEQEVDRRMKRADGAPVSPDTTTPRMVVVVDGLHQIGADHPWFVKNLGALARDGRELGLHIAMGLTLDDSAAIRLLGGELCDEAQIRFALRTHGPEESRRISSLPAASALRVDTPGRAHLALPDGRVLAIQAPRISGRMASSATARATVTQVSWAELGSAPPRRPADAAGGAQPGGPTDLALFVETVRRAASR